MPDPEERGENPLRFVKSYLQLDKL